MLSLTHRFFQSIKHYLNFKRCLFLYFAHFVTFCFPLIGIAADYDYVFVGTSPISLLEALYRSHLGDRVLILESSGSIGGAWKTIHVCNVADVDMGCHQIGADPKLKDFLENFLGCQLVPMNRPYSQQPILQTTDQGFYFAHGCHELIQALERQIQTSSLTLLLNHKLDHITIDFEHAQVILSTNEKKMSSSKIVVTPHSYVEIENYPHLQKPRSSRHYHLYLLIEDPSEPKFTYYNSFCSGMSRAINLTPFSSIEYPKQLIAIQTVNAESLEKPNYYHEQFIQKGLLDPRSTLVAFDTYIYEQAHFHPYILQQQHPEASVFFEILGTEGIWNIVPHITKWEKVLKKSVENFNLIP